MTVPIPGTKCYCNLLAQQKGLDPVGYAHDFYDAIVIETPLPWKRNIYQQAGALPQEAVDLLQLWLKRYHEGEPYRHGALMIAPDPQYSRPGFRRVMYYARPDGAFARFDKIEYLVPEERLGRLIWSLFEAKDELTQFDLFRTFEHDATRDLLVCTHGTVDAACAKFGYPLYHYLHHNHAADGVRVWRVSHFGGHVFAPTMMDMPIGHYWAYVEATQADQIVRCNADVRALYRHYRGWAGLEDPFLQAAERELWMQFGWDWFGYCKSGKILTRAADVDDPQWAETQIDYASPDGVVSGSYTTRVEIRSRVSTFPGTASKTEFAYPQYVVTGQQKAQATTGGLDCQLQ